MASYKEEQKFGSAFLDAIIDWIRSTLLPDDVFDDAQLNDWALTHGYKEDNGE